MAGHRFDARDGSPVCPIGLIADPDSDTRELYGAWLDAHGFDVIQAANGRDALALAQYAAPSLLITETWLPQLDGFELCDKLRRLPMTSSMPIVVVTGDARPVALNRAHRAGANVVLAKPVTINTLDNTLVFIRTQLDTNRVPVASLEAHAFPDGVPLPCPDCSGPLAFRRSDASNLVFFCQHCTLSFALGQMTRSLRRTG